MQEKFHQFNRQDNSNVIKEGLTEMEPEVEKRPTPINSIKPEVVGIPEKSEPDVVTDKERETLFARLETPRDILHLPTGIRREGLATLREKIAKRYLSISGIQTALFDRIDELSSAGTLDTELLKNEIAVKADEYNFTDEDRKVIDGLLYHFCRNYEKLKGVQNLPEQELLKRLIKNPDFLPLIKGGYHAKVTPYSIHFDFENEEDFRLFVSNNEGEAKGEYKSTYGLSYYNGDYPITASGYKPNSEATFRHEIQHKKFGAITIDRILLDEEAERATRNEILARFAEHGRVNGIFDDVYYYGFAKKYGVDQALYEKMLRDAVNAIQELQYIYFQKEEILGLLSKEKLATWPKIVERMRGTKVGRDLIQQRKPKRVKRKTG
ncbi:MAG: hypothetical protein A3C08_01010 [Candidatus Taylorbacteria bacterium RIFCSPHIGHO2_02_FULL_47_18]|uniref:Uncharacterized protein n=1 Tax=Candidatus Taylorbacteria bacterium RIFCSPLOWO2_01_FULL_48_100 TaxID=1802322 RepID=A0A1G2NCF8_9BACT|nr:MAG: hypothetical protein A2670_00420 [Candidatus Taylorbacteria bacterium RIFCSPHIGHO2_01_FULL_48_38]OHA28266.1 MAG: hypothetical protein A3C08_01010 [Candidatus Taylorbacteria bacterium RIFCSPHIGHO2_02_FULL_47_18]OHA33778.1 MAG: hypothetical protein A2938_00520 [Candidatus Taylorbacteria bacterium RIFCSPLOWO2_01_FULL_48_100]OHA40595.1 MAG: hypothetical protein A3J31_02195 [Candidatus Taylorbacteria bacterium RIFCSPLOWO2_02_FULL_48_16]OHA44763.1 MAG: hypothetical protein A3H13_00555 [Candid